MVHHTVLEYAYKNDVVSVGTFRKATLSLPAVEKK